MFINQMIWLHIKHLMDTINKIGLVLVPVCQNTKNVYEDLKRELSNLIKELSTKYEVSIIPFQINYDMEFINELEFDKSLVKILKPKHLWDTLDYMYEQDCIIGMRSFSCSCYTDEKIFYTNYLSLKKCRIM